MDVVWFMSGCIEEGHQRPTNLSTAEQDALKMLPLGYGPVIHGFFLLRCSKFVISKMTFENIKI